MRVVALGDVGVIDDMMHIGDEAMFQAANDELAARGVDLVAVSSAPAETAARYGIDAVPPHPLRRAGPRGVRGTARGRARRSPRAATRSPPTTRPAP